jgi:hypothetical protein
MTHADKIIIAAGRALRDRVLSISDDIEFDDFRREMFQTHGITLSDLARISGVAIEHVIGKQRAGIVTSFAARDIDPIPAYVEQAKPYHGKALNATEHGDPDAPEDFAAWWLEHCPDEYRVYLLRQALEQAADMHWIVALYLEHDGRFPDPEGFAFWLRLIAEGHSEDTVRGWILDGFAEAGGE